MEKMIIVRVEPSQEFSKILGYPYFVEKKVPLSDFLSVLSKEELKALEDGKEIPKMLKAAVE